MKNQHILVLLLLSALACGQDNHGLRSAGKDLSWNDHDKLYQRAAGSQLVIVGTVVKVEGVLPRQPDKPCPNPTPQMLDCATVELSDAGHLYTIKTDQMLCQNAIAGPQYVYLFRHLNQEPMQEVAELERALQAGGRYLFFLVPSEEQKVWVDHFSLDSSRTYYRSIYRGSQDAWRGIVPLTAPTALNPHPAQPPILGEVTQLCQALTSSDQQSALNKLTASGDQVLQKEAEEAKQAIRSRAKQ